MYRQNYSLKLLLYRAANLSWDIYNCFIFPVFGLCISFDGIKNGFVLIKCFSFMYTKLHATVIIGLMSSAVYKNFWQNRKILFWNISVEQAGR